MGTKRPLCIYSGEVRELSGEDTLPFTNFNSMDLSFQGLPYLDLTSADYPHLHYNGVFRETPSGTKNGVNTVFTLDYTPSWSSEHVYVNGILQNMGIGNDYTISGNTITFTTAPASTDVILVTYWR